MKALLQPLPRIARRCLLSAAARPVPAPRPLLGAGLQRRPLRTTSPRHNLHITNPRRDPDTGDEMRIHLTPRAIARLSAIGSSSPTSSSSSSSSSPSSSPPSPPTPASTSPDPAPDTTSSQALRLLVESGGCHGFQYTISLSSTTDPTQDVVFTDRESGARVVVDEASLALLKGSTVDFEQELIGSQFKILNPLASSSCGCGTSFDIKF